MEDKPLILRTVYLDQIVDENHLRPLCAKLKITKGELIRWLIEVGLNHQDELEGQGKA